MRVKRGPVLLAKIAGAPLFPLAWATSSRSGVAKTWDKFGLPLPFGKGALVWGDPIAPPSPGADDAEIEAVRLMLEVEMNRIAAEADRIAGVAVIEPAALKSELAQAASEQAANAK
jgi:lysophospholipid acyltransferase (LPLAT)-like uncharacterized protein